MVVFLGVAAVQRTNLLYITTDLIGYSYQVSPIIAYVISQLCKIQNGSVVCNFCSKSIANT